jgi:hypothetical protein
LLLGRVISVKGKAMIEEFMAWVRSNEQRLQAAPLFSQIRKSELDDETVTPPLHKANVGILTTDLTASFTVWDTGMCEIIFMNNLTSEDFVAVDRKFDTPSQLLTMLNKYGELLVNGASFDDLKSENQS